MGKGELQEAGSKRVPSLGEDKEAPKGKRQKLKNSNPEILELRRTIHQCCSNNDLQTAISAYDQALAQGVKVEAQSFYNLLSLCDGLGERNLHIGTPRPPSAKAPDSATSTSASICDDSIVSLPTRQAHAERIRQHMGSLQIPLTETAYTALIKLSARTGNLSDAEKYIEEAEGVQQCRPKLRMYSPLLVAYCELGQIAAALKVWQRISQRGLVLAEREYAALMRGATLAGDAVVLERVVSDLSEDVLVPSKESGRAIVDWFESPHASKNGAEDSTTRELLEQIKIPYSDLPDSMARLECRHANGWKIDPVCHIDCASGTLTTGCLKGSSLMPATVSATSWQSMQEMNETIVVSGKLENDSSKFQGGKKGRKKDLGARHLEQRKRHWAAFQTYLAGRVKDRKLDVVIDGANVGYYEQNFSGAPRHVSYHQIDWVVKHFLGLNKSVLLVMHSRHFTHNMMPRRFESLMQSWLDLGVLYRTPPGMNDDWFWLHAALYSGPGTLVLSNDEMRDHHFQMMAPRSFLRWKDRHLVRFTFGTWDEQDSNKGKAGRKVVLTHPERYSRRIQRVEDGLVIPLPQRGDEKRFLDGVFTAVEEEEKETYLCIRPNTDNN